MRPSRWRLTIIGMMAAIAVAAILLGAYRQSCVKTYSDQYRINRNRHAHSAEIFRHANRLAAQGVAKLRARLGPDGKLSYIQMRGCYFPMTVDIFRDPARVYLGGYPEPDPPGDPSQEALLDRRAKEIASQCLEMANYHERMAEKWELAVIHPWRSILPDGDAPHPRLQIEQVGAGGCSF